MGLNEGQAVDLEVCENIPLVLGRGGYKVVVRVIAPTSSVRVRKQNRYSK